ncbi:unnamed protein product [Mesocestoides corti]|uniref:Amino acid transporter transmembrane domain-containing protein n=1 Tax=Mesocestoides corti TaxID=53468 RepID=A0A0R3UID3_MESCO|nr:unnamed protein product [Mesocestoides corti]
MQIGLYLPVVVLSGFWALVLILGPLFVPKSPNRGTIGFLFGMLVGLNVAISDMSTDVFATVGGIKVTIRFPALLFSLTLVSPFCFIRRIEALSAASSVAVILYSIFLLSLVIGYAVPKILSADFVVLHFRLWRPEGLVHCAPILASSLCCQVQVNTIYSSLKSASYYNMKRVLVWAVGFILICYLTAGFFGYIAFYNGPGSTVAGNILNMYPEDFHAAYIRLSFLYTMMASFPLILFPLRTSLHSLLFEEFDNGPLCAEPGLVIPNSRFRWLTAATIAMSVIVSQTTNRVEVILAHTGSLAGALICYVLPAVIHLRAAGTIMTLASGLAICLLLFGFFVLISPILTLLCVDA